MKRTYFLVITVLALLLAACGGEDAGALSHPEQETVSRPERESASRPAQEMEPAPGDEPDPNGEEPVFADGEYEEARSYLSHMVSAFLYEAYGDILLDYVYVQPEGGAQDTSLTRITVGFLDTAGRDDLEFLAALSDRFGHRQLGILEVKIIEVGAYVWTYDE